MPQPRLAPVAIGALGGSGTRVFARLLADLGFYTGAWLNEADDNLLFSELLKDPATGRNQGYDERRAVRRFARLMQGGWPTPGDLALAAAARRACGKAAGPRQVAAIGRRMLQTSTGARQGDTVGWGWKEPFTHLCLDSLAVELPDLRYVHVVRHGLDMAFSANRNQLVRFGSRFGVAPPRSVEEEPVRQLELWVATTRRVLDVAPGLFGDRFLLMRYDDLVTRPAEGIGQLAAFVGLPDAAVDRLAEGISPSSVGRFRERDLSIFPAGLLAEVEDLGFSID